MAKYCFREWDVSRITGSESSMVSIMCIIVNWTLGSNSGARMITYTTTFCQT